MPPDESPQAKYERLQQRLQQEILNNYPNPERKGCPGGLALTALAGRPFEESIEDDPHWQHVTHCSECYREFLAIQAAVKRRKQIRKEAIRWSVAGAAITAALALFLIIRGSGGNGSKRPQNAELAYVSRTISIESMTRSARGAGESKPFVLKRDREALTIQLPVGSEPGTYEFALSRPAGKPILTASAPATIHDGVTSFVVRVDLSPLQPGQYQMEVRQVPWDWTYYPVVLE